MKILSKDFYLQPSLTVAQELLGKLLVFNSHQGIITETEAYFGYEDSASHAFRGKTPRTEAMFKEGGHAYIYFIYGMYFCFNIVTERENFPAAILIRGVKLTTEPFTYLNGPGKLCKFLGINKEHNKINLINSESFFIADIGKKLDYIATPRIGIKVATEKFWRFLATDI